MPGTHHSRHWSTTGSPNSSFMRESQLMVPVMGTLLSTSPSVIHILRPVLMRMGQSQQLALENMVQLVATSSLQASKSLQGTWKCSWMVTWLKKWEMPYMSSQMTSSAMSWVRLPWGRRTNYVPGGTLTFWQRHLAQRLSMLVLVAQNFLSAIFRTSLQAWLLYPKMQAALMSSYCFQVQQPWLNKFSYWQMLMSTSFPGSQHSRGSVQALLIMMPLRLMVMARLGSLFLWMISLARQGMQMPAQLYPVMQKSFFLRLGNLLKNASRALQLSMATELSLCLRSRFDVLKPTPPGDSIQRRLAFMFQAYALMSKVTFPSWKTKGPFSQTMPSREEQPGPPFSQRTMGSLSGSRWESKKTQWKAAVSKSRQPGWLERYLSRMGVSRGWGCGRDHQRAR